ncbi:MAG: histidinol dehydrogenase [Gammaproteobacteria bacterium]|nr:histidinol dehydrogenase [Gammaproteobacteria bacterium]
MSVWAELDNDGKKRLLARPKLKNAEDLPDQVSSIIKAVRNTGDKALRFYSQKFDAVDSNDLVLSQQLQQQQLAKLTAERKAAIDLAYQNIRTFHSAQLPKDIKLETSPGVQCELKYAAFESVGLYIPGGSAPLPSTVLMLGVPAQLAGCRRTVLVTPPGQPKASDIAPEIIYAAQLCGISEIYTVGGAQAVAALAYGTDSIAKVDKIFGPGNRFVTEAKQQVSKDPLGAAIDMPAGPSEVLVIADDSASPAFVAADLLSQAEHGVDSQVVLISNSQTLLDKTVQAMNEQLLKLPRAIIAKKAIDHSRFILTADLDTAALVSNLYAPEHLIIQTNEDQQLLPKLSNAASIFVGAWTPESAGDYASGTNHVLPTYGYSRTHSSLSLLDFYRRYTVQTISSQGIRAIGPAIMTLASAEGLTAHANAVKVRLTALEKQADQTNQFKQIPVGSN